MDTVRASELRCFDSFLTTLEKYFDDIANYFIDRHTSGFVEGFNNKLKVIKRRCYGILNVTHLFQRIQMDLYGHSLSAMKIIEQRVLIIIKQTRQTSCKILPSTSTPLSTV